MSDAGAKEFWESRIERWDDYRHDNKLTVKGLPCLFTRNPQNSLEFRYKVLKEHLAQYVKGKRVVEFGCGTGRLAAETINLGAAFYEGYDIAENAINRAREREKNISLKDKMIFHRADVIDIDAVKADFVFSTGFIPCLSDQALDHLFKISNDIDFFHISIEPKPGLHEIFHNLYRHISGAHKFQGIRRPVDDIFETLKNNGCKKLHVYRHQNLGSLVCYSNLPFPAGQASNSLR